MAKESHGPGELAGFYRAGAPNASDAEVFAFVRGLLAAWIGRGGLRLGPEYRERAGLRSVGELLPYLDGHGPALLGLASDRVLPEVDLAEQAFRDVEWLRGAAERSLEADGYARTPGDGRGPCPPRREPAWTTRS